MTAIDLLYDNAAAAKQIIGDFQPAITKAGYLAFARGLFKKERWSVGAKKAGTDMISQARYQVFVSSTYDDLRGERQQATQAILEIGCFPSGMELFPASDDTQWELIKRVIEESDYYVVIVAGRYGSLGPEGASYTEMEY